MVSASVAKWKKPLPFRNVIARASHCFRRLVLLIVYPGAISFPGKQCTHTLLSIWHKRWSDESGFLWHLYCPVLTLTCPLRELSVADRHLHTQGHLTRPAVLGSALTHWFAYFSCFENINLKNWLFICCKISSLSQDNLWYLLHLSVVLILWLISANCFRYPLVMVKLVMKC